MNKILIALLSGVAIGILIAPRKGSETRQQLLADFDELAGGVKEEISAWKDEIQKELTEPDNISVPIV